MCSAQEEGIRSPGAEVSGGCQTCVSRTEFILSPRAARVPNHWPISAVPTDLSLRFIFMYPCASIPVYVRVCLSTQGRKRRQLDLSELEVQVFISSQWKLGTELQSSARETNSSLGWASLQTLKLDAFGKGVSQYNSYYLGTH